jgi:hypothetical protein
VGEAAEDSTLDGALEWWRFICGGGILRWSRHRSTVVIAPLVGGGGGSGHTADLVSSDSLLASLALILDARILVGRPQGPIWIRVVYLYADRLGGDSGIDMTSTESSSSSSSAMVTSTTSSTSATPSSPSLFPSLRLGEDNIDRLSATGYGHGPVPWMDQGGSRRPLGEVVGYEGSIGQWCGGGRWWSLHNPNPRVRDRLWA